MSGGKGRWGMGSETKGSRRGRRVLQAGQSLTELAIASKVLLVVLAGGIDLGGVEYNHLGVEGLGGGGGGLRAVGAAGRAGGTAPGGGEGGRPPG